MRWPFVFTALAALAIAPAFAGAPQTVVLDVQNMTCALCPITVKKSLQQVPGVAEANEHAFPVVRDLLIDGLSPERSLEVSQGDAPANDSLHRRSAGEAVPAPRYGKTARGRQSHLAAE